MGAYIITFLVKSVRFQQGHRLAQNQSVVDWKVYGQRLEVGDFPAQPLSRMVDYFTVSYPLTWDGLSLMYSQLGEIDWDVSYPVFNLNGGARTPL